MDLKTQIVIHSLIFACQMTIKMAWQWMLHIMQKMLKEKGKF